MSNILDQIAAKARYHEFRPKTIREFFALRLAHKLSDDAAASHYLELADRHSEERLLSVFRRLPLKLNGTVDMARRFHVELGNAHGKGFSPAHGLMAALKVERRSVAIAVFLGERLDYTQIRQLSSSREKAQASAVGFVNWICGNFGIESAALESMPPDSDIQRADITRSIVSVLRDSGVTIWEVPKPELLSAFGHPAPRSRKELRDVVHSLWPILNGNTGVLDAAALGLYVHFERLFSI